MILILNKITEAVQDSTPVFLYEFGMILGKPKNKNYLAGVIQFLKKERDPNYLIGKSYEMNLTLLSQKEIGKEK